jgi:high-affinity nickel permease
MDLTLMTALAIGFALGLKHALDADHLAAVAVMVNERKSSLAATSMIGFAWGAGHASSILIVSLAVVVFGMTLPAGLAHWTEFAVGIVLAGMGLRLLIHYRGGAVLHAHTHVHGKREHFHPHVHESEPEAAHSTHHELPAAARKFATASERGRRPFLIGMLHGLAGSAALMILVLTTIQGSLAQLTYMALFAAGSILGMMAMSVLVGLPLSYAKDSGLRHQRLLRVAAGLISFLVGLSVMAAIAPALSA